MKLPLVPSPTRLAHDVGAVTGFVTSTAGTVLSLVPRVEHLISRVETLLDTVEDVAASAQDAVTRTQAVIGRADQSVGRTDAVLSAGEASVRQAQAMLDTGTGLVGRADDLVGRADGLVGRSGDLVGRAEGLLTQFEQPLATLLPSLRKFSDTLAPDEVEAAIALIDRLPVLLGHVEDDLLPMLATLDRVGPDVHEILEIVEDLRRVVTGLPGVRLFRRRADDEPERAVESSPRDEAPVRRPRG
ncbi:MAG: hypothetical protein ACRDYU_03425 [Actinomycetes bacterium]